MCLKPRCRLAAVALCAIAVLCLTRSAVCQAPGAAAPKQAPGAAGQKAREKDAGADEKIIREQSIYVPYEKLRKVFEKEGRGVFLPYEKFQELWKAARERIKPAAEEKPPVGALVTEIENVAAVAKDVVNVRAVLKIELLAEGWSQIPLRLADAAITKATLEGQPARIVSDGKQGYKLLVEKKGKEPKQIELVLEYSKAITRAPGQNSVSLEAPQAPVNRWRVEIPESGVKVNIHPMIAAPEVPAEKAAPKPKPGAKPGEAAKPAAKPEGTVVLAFVGAAPTVRIEWTPKAEGATGLAALASVQAQQQVFLGEGVTRTRAELVYTITRAELGRLAVEVPAGQKVVNVFDPNVRQWSVKEPGAGEKTQQIEVQLFEPAKGSQNLTVELEKFSGDAAKSTLEVPVVRAVDAGRQQGHVVVQVDQGLRAEAAQSSGLLQVDAGELPDSLRRSKWTFAYRFAAVPFVLKLDVEKVQPRIVADSLVEAYLQPEELSVDVLTIYTVERAGAFKLELDVPAGFEVRNVEGRAAAGAAAVQVDSHPLEGENKTRLVVNLSRKAFGKVGLLVQLHKDLDHPELRSPAEESAKIPLPFARVAPGTAERATGRLLVYAPESLQVNPEEAEGLRNISFAEALEGIETARAQKPEGARPVLAFAYTQQPATLVLDARRRKPQVTVRQLLVVGIEEGVVKYQATFFYDVLYSGVKSLRIDVPAAVAGKLRNNTPGIRESVIAPAPQDLAEAYVAWSLTGETELLGSGRVELAWQDTLQKLEIGQPLALAIPRLVPKGVDRTWGQIVLTKAETIDVHEKGEPKGLRLIDPQHDLMPGAKVTGAARALEFHEDWLAGEEPFEVEATRYKLEDVKRTSIERAALRMVVTRAGQINVQALYRMRSARQRLAVKLPPGAQFDTQPLKINGRVVALESGDKQQNLYYVPVPPVDPDSEDRSVVLELRYTVPVPDEGLRLDLPVFPSEPAVQKVYLCAYLPEEVALLGAVGPWTEEFRWELDDYLHWRPAHLFKRWTPVGWVTEGVNVSGNPEATFQTDGQLWVFSTLAPQAPPEGSLRLKTVDQLPLDAAVFAVVIVAGLLLVPAGAGLRAMVIGALVIALVVCGVFAPIFAVQVLDAELGAAVFIVLVIWVVWHFARRRPRKGRPQTGAPTPALPSPPPEGAEEAPAEAVVGPPIGPPAEVVHEPPDAGEEEPAQPEIVEEGPDALPWTPEPAGGETGAEDRPQPESEEGGKTDA